MAQVKEILKLRSGEPDFGFEQQSCLDYANKFCKLNIEDATELQKNLEEIAGITSEAAIKLVDILPQSPSTLQVIIAKEKITLDEAGLSKAMELIKASREKMIEPPAPKVQEPQKEEKAAEEKEDEGKAKEEAKTEAAGAKAQKKTTRKKKAQKAEDE